MTIQSILLPVFVLVFLLFFLLGWTIKERMSAMRSGLVSSENAAAGRNGGWQGKAQQVGNCLQNQFELPPLFYVLVILAIMTRKADYTFVILEWLFVLARLGHAFIFTTSNNMRQRGGVFAICATVLLIMWVIFAIRILLSPAFGTI